MTIQPPEDQTELLNWLEHPITQWFREELINKFDPHKALLFADVNTTVAELKGQQTVIRIIKDPRELME